jgi:hypothetical protein
MEILRLFHLDESRHTALPANYFKEFPLPAEQRSDRRGRLRRLGMALPALPLVMLLEPELAELGIDAFDFAGSVLRKVSQLSLRAGFIDPAHADKQLRVFNGIFNRYCALTRGPAHRTKDFMAAETTRGADAARIEREVFAPVPAAAAASR